MAASGNTPPKSYWIISSLALVWNIIGMVIYISVVKMTPEALQAMPADERALYTDIPAWATGANGIAVTAGVLGCVMLLLRTGWAVPVFLVSLAAVLVQMYHAFVMTDMMEVLGPASAVGPAIVIAIGVGLIWYSRSAKEAGWFR